MSRHTVATAALKVTRWRARELPALARGRYAQQRLSVPTRLVIGRSDPVVTAASVEGFEAHADDMTVELVDEGHFLPEECPEAVADRILAGSGKRPGAPGSAAA